MMQIYGEQDGNRLDVKPGVICAAKFDADECWYRARVVSAANDTTWWVLFVDYGNKETVQKDNIRKLEGSLYQYPPLAIHCQIKKITQAFWQGLDDAKKEYFLSKIDQQHFMVSFELLDDSSGKFLISLIDESGEDVLKILNKPVPSPISSPKPSGHMSPNGNFDARQAINEVRTNQRLSPKSFDRSRLGPRSPGGGNRPPSPGKAQLGPQFGGERSPGFGNNRQGGPGFNANDGRPPRLNLRDGAGSSFQGQQDRSSREGPGNIVERSGGFQSRDGRPPRDGPGNRGDRPGGFQSRDDRPPRRDFNGPQGGIGGGRPQLNNEASGDRSFGDSKMGGFAGKADSSLHAIFNIIIQNLKPKQI